MEPKYEYIDGIKCFDVEQAEENAHYPEDAFEKIYEIEDSHFWFQTRNQCIEYLVNQFGEIHKPHTFLEIGCGTGSVLKHLKNNTNLTLSGAEIYLTALRYARKRLPNVNFFQANVLNLPFEAAYDYVAMFDVLEHIEEDILAMKNVNKTLLPGGIFFISVPQYSFMWSAADDEALHKRRYSKQELREKLETSGFKILYCGSYMFTLFPVMYLSRMLGKKRAGNYTELAISPVLNQLFKIISKIDIWLIRGGIKLPWGGSILCVAKKK
jgi:SAM-dependent methyltransferase